MSALFVHLQLLSDGKSKKTKPLCVGFTAMTGGSSAVGVAGQMKDVRSKAGFLYTMDCMV